MTALHRAETTALNRAEMNALHRADPCELPRAELNALPWAQRLNDALMEVPLNFIPRIAEPKITLGELMNIHEGMVVEIPPIDEVKIFVEGESLFEGSIGERDGKIAVRITG